MALTFFSVTDPFAKPGNNTVVSGINATGQIVGGYTDSLNKTHGFLYTAGTYVTLDVPGATFTDATAVNSSGQIVGIFTIAILLSTVSCSATAALRRLIIPIRLYTGSRPAAPIAAAILSAAFSIRQVSTHSC